MNKSVFLVVVLLVVFPSNQVLAQTGSSKTQLPQRNAEAQSLYEDGMQRLEMGQISEAVERFQRALKIDPEYAEAYSGLGRGLFKLGQWENSIAPFRRAFALKAKERERQDALQKNRIRGDEPRITPTVPASKPQPPKGTNKPLPAPRINTGATFGSALEPPARAEPGLHQASIKSEILPADPPPELPEKADVKPADVPIAMNAKPSAPPVDVTSVPAPSRSLPTNETAETKTSELVGNPKWVSGVPEDSSQSIVVDGLVKYPGTKFLKAKTVPLAAILAEAQPLVQLAKVTVVRDSNQILETELGHTTDMSFLVQAGDLITLHPYVTESLYIGGKVKFPGEKTYRVGLTLLQVIMAAGGATSNSNIAEIVRENGAQERMRFDLKAIESGKAADPLVKPRDRIILR
jgi:protein involved in polysaccharide export with SLBB domain